MFNQNIEKEEQYIEKIEEELVNEEPKGLLIDFDKEPEEEVVEPEPKATAHGTYRFEIKKKEETRYLHRYTNETYTMDSFELHVYFDIKADLFGEIEFDIISSERLLGGVNETYDYISYTEEEKLLVDFLEANDKGDFLMNKIKKKIEHEVMERIDKMNADKFKELIKQGDIEISFDLNIDKDILKK